MPISVAVRQCRLLPPPPRRWHERFEAGNVTVDLLTAIITHAVRNRLAPSNGLPADLELVPLPCLLEPDGTARLPPRLGRFAILHAPWMDYGFATANLRRPCLHLLQPSTHVTQRCNATLLERLVFLSVEAPAFIPLGLAPPQRIRFPPAHVDGGLPAFQIPYPSSAGATLPPAPPLEARDALVAFVANTRGSNSSTIGRSPLRQRLHAECAASQVPHVPATASCLMVGGSRDDGLWRQGGARTALSLYQRAHYCLQPYGDTATRKGFYDALAAGCVNAVFTREGWNGTDAWFGAFESWSVLVPREAVESGTVLEFLASIPASRLRRLHANVLAVRQRFHYNVRTPAGGSEDAISTILSKLPHAVESGSVSVTRRRARAACRTLAAVCARTHQARAPLRAA